METRGIELRPNLTPVLHADCSLHCSTNCFCRRLTEQRARLAVMAYCENFIGG